MSDDKYFEWSPEKFQESKENDKIDDQNFRNKSKTLKQSIGINQAAVPAVLSRDIANKIQVTPLRNERVHKLRSSTENSQLKESNIRRSSTVNIKEITDLKLNKNKDQSENTYSDDYEEFEKDNSNSNWKCKS